MKNWRAKPQEPDPTNGPHKAVMIRHRFGIWRVAHTDDHTLTLGVMTTHGHGPGYFTAHTIINNNPDLPATTIADGYQQHVCLTRIYNAWHTNPNRKEPNT